MSADSVTADRPLHAELHYHVLSHLPLGRDAASLHDPRRPAHPWVAPLVEGYRAAAGKLVLQGLPLYVENLDQLLHTLEPGGLRLLADAAGQRLAELFADALRQQLPAVRQRWEQAREADEARFAELLPWLHDELAPLRSALFNENTPALRLRHCASLGPHGRIGTLRRHRVVAVSLATEREWLLCQIFHEETHAVSDQTMSSDRTTGRDTAVGSAGYAQHRELERRAVELGQQLIEQQTPHLLGAYAAWRARFGV